jgi:putative endonuclease
VATWYAAAGYTVLARNWRVRAGELDLVLRSGGVLVFCEVKTRRGARFGEPFEAVTARKQARIRGLAREWLSATRQRAEVVRFDVASVRPTGRGWEVAVIEAAF